MNNNDILNYFRDSGALLEGHFILSSGYRSSMYLQCAKIFMDPIKSEYLCKILANKIKKNIDLKNVDLIVSPAMGGVIVGYEIGRLLKKETVFCERVEGKFKLRRGFSIKANTRVLIVEDVITTGKSSIECSKIVTSAGATLVGFACIIDRSNDKSSLKQKIVSQVKLNIPTYKKNNLPDFLKKIPVTSPGSRRVK